LAKIALKGFRDHAVTKTVKMAKGDGARDASLQPEDRQGTNKKMIRLTAISAESHRLPGGSSVCCQIHGRVT